MNRERLSAQVSSWHPSTNEVTQSSFISTVVPYGLRLRHTILGGTITNVTASAGTVTYTCLNNFTAGDRVTITDVLPVAYNLTNVQVATASATQFTVTNAATGTFVSGGNAFTTFTIPTGITWVYVIMAGGGRGGFFGYGGYSAEVSWGWTLAQNTCIIGAGGGNGGYTRYGHIIARGGEGRGASANYYGIPGGANYGDNNPQNGGPGANAGSGGGAASGTAQGGNGGDGISGGSGGQGNATTGTSTGGNGGSGLAGGGGGGGGGTTTGTRTGGNGGNGLGIDGTVYTGGLGSSRTNANGGGGGGAGIAGNGSNASAGTGGNGGLGGGGGGSQGGTGGNGILYIFY